MKRVSGNVIMTLEIVLLLHQVVLTSVDINKLEKTVSCTITLYKNDLKTVLGSITVQGTKNQNALNKIDFLEQLFG